MLVERVNKIPGLFYSEYPRLVMLHFFIKRLGFSPTEYDRMFVTDREVLYELEQKVIEEENKNNNDNPDFA